MRYWLYLVVLFLGLLAEGQSVKCPSNQSPLPYTTTSDIFGNTYQRFCVDFNGNIIATISTLNGISSLAGLTTVQTQSVQQVPNLAFSLTDGLGVSHFFISNSSPYTNTFIQGNGSGSVFLGSAARTSVNDTTGIISMLGSSTGTVQIQAAANAGTPVLTWPTSTGNIVADSASQTETNKRISPRVSSIADGTSITVNSDTTDLATQTNTQVAGTLTINAPTGTPTDGQKLLIRIKTTNAQTYSFNATFTFSNSTVAPTTTIAGKTDYIGAIWNAVNSKWEVVAVDQGH